MRQRADKLGFVSICVEAYNLRPRKEDLCNPSDSLCTALLLTPIRLKKRKDGSYCGFANSPVGHSQIAKNWYNMQIAAQLLSPCTMYGMRGTITMFNLKNGYSIYNSMVATNHSSVYAASRYAHNEQMQEDRNKIANEMNAAIYDKTSM